jgi:GrpB-like predicted nucleotidyltransferase (UPF0157 family)
VPEAGASGANLPEVEYLAERPRLDGPVLLAEPDPGWAERGRAECANVSAALTRHGGAEAFAVEHAGSTSVPGLAAKPILDLVLSVPDPTDEAAYVPALEHAGYHLVLREPGWYEHRLLRRTDALVDPAVNLHVFGPAAEEVRRMIAFRDHLRRDADDRALYERTKRDLAGRRWAYVQDYADAKSAVVDEIMARALR